MWNSTNRKPLQVHPRPPMTQAAVTDLRPTISVHKSPEICDSMANRTTSSSLDPGLLIIAVEHGHLNITRLITKRCLDRAEAGQQLFNKSVDIPGILQSARLAVTARQRAGPNLEITRYLVKHGADVRANDDQALRTAIGTQQFEIAKFLASPE